MRKRGLFIMCIGAIIFGISFIIADSILMSDFSGPAGFDADSIFESIFDEITDEIIIAPGSTETISYIVESDNSPILLAIHIVDYIQEDVLSIKLSDTYGNVYGEFVQSEEMRFEIIESAREGVLDIAVTNSGNKYVAIFAMFSEDPENSAMYTDPNSPLNTLIIPLAITGILIIMGFLVLVVGVIIFIVDMRQQRRVDGFDDWSSGR